MKNNSKLSIGRDQNLLWILEMIKKKHQALKMDHPLKEESGYSKHCLSFLRLKHQQIKENRIFKRPAHHQIHSKVQCQDMKMTLKEVLGQLRVKMFKIDKT